MMRRLGLIVMLCVSPLTLADVMIKGRLLNEALQPLSNARVMLAGNTVYADKHGEYQLKVDKADIYQLSFVQNGFYKSVQTFSHFELENQSKPFIIPDITLVEKTRKRVMLAFSGDAMMGRRYYQPFFGDPVLIREGHRLEDSKAIVKHVKPYMELADIATTNLETQVFDTPPGDAAGKSVAFYSKPEILDALAWAGIDYVTLGNNHTYDYKAPGLEATLRHLQASSLSFSGAGVNEDSALQAHRQSVNGVEFSMLGYNGWEGRTSPSQVAEKNKGGPAFGSNKNIVQSVAREKALNRVPIVQYHGGYEYSDQPSGLTEQRLKAAIDSGAAVAIGHHPHVTQGLELHNGKLIAYSMGNFIFDQYIPATPYSFVLYVWLDEGKFHRAELVPIYLKGYKPTPATGINRFTVMKRIAQLSAQRGTQINSSGGHGVVSAMIPQIPEETTRIQFAANSRIAPLYLHNFQHDLAEVKLLPGMRYRLGTNLMNGSDFESFNYFESPERSWFFDRENTVLNNYGASGTKSLGVNLSANTPTEIGLQPFRRIFSGDNPTTVTAKFKTDKSAQVRFYWQGRRYSQSFFEAREKSSKELIGEVELQGGSDWQVVELDFNSVRYNYPSNGYRAYRVFAEITLTDGQIGKVDVDDFAVIEWQTAFTHLSKPMYINIESKQASFIGIDKRTEKPVVLTWQ